MAIRTEVTAELRCRTGLLAAEIQVWNELSESATSGMGIHRSQIDALELLQQSFQEQLDAGFQRVQAAPDEAFPARVADLEADLTGAHGIMSVFRMVLGQRRDKVFFRRALDAADLVAADCYQVCMTRAVAAGLVDEPVREPPLTYLNAASSPAALTRAHVFGAFGMPITQLREQPLPIGVVSLPFHHTAALWTYCSLYHEVGHLVDADLGLSRVLGPKLAAAGLDAYWTPWLAGELVADVFGMLFGGEAYLRTVLKLLYLPAGQVLDLDPLDPHPNPYLRVLWLGRLLVALDPTAKPESALAEWIERYGEPAEMAAPAGDLDRLCSVLLDSPLLDAPLLDSPLLESAPPAGATLRGLGPAKPDVDRWAIGRLERYLRTGQPQHEPALTISDEPFPVRLVPAAAQLAVGNGAQPEAVHQLGLGFIDELRRAAPVYLADDGLSDQRRQALRARASRITLQEGTP